MISNLVKHHLENEPLAKKIDVEDFFNGREQLLFLRESLIMFKIHHQSIGQFIGLNFLSFLLITFENKFQT